MHRFAIPILGLLIAVPAVEAGTYRALPPTAAPMLEEAFARAEPLLLLRDASIDVDRVEAVVCQPGSTKTCYDVMLTDPLGECAGLVAGAWCVSFPGKQLEPELQKRLLEALAVDADQKIWKVVTARPGELGLSQTPKGTIRSTWLARNLPWLSTAGGMATLAWWLGLVGMVGLLGLEALAWLRQRPWHVRARIFLLAELAGLFALALIVRLVLVPAGPGNLYSNLPNPASWPTDFQLFGPGYPAWMLVWFGLLGASDEVAFLVGALVGAATVWPCYALAWAAGKERGRWWGLASGLVVALWPIHARLSPTDDPAGLIAFLLVTALALIVAAGRLDSRRLLIAGWLAAALPATTRPEPFLSLAVLVGLVAWHRPIRRLQIQPLAMSITAIILAICALIGTVTISDAMRGFSPVGSMELWHGFRLVGFEGGSILGPPRSHLVLGLVFLVGFGASLVATRGWSGIWLAAALLPAFPTVSLAGQDVVTARYQLALVPVAAVCLGIGIPWLGERLWVRLSHPVRWALPIVPLGWLLVASMGLFRPPPEPTFRLEYAFFRQHLPEIPSGCQLIKVRWNVDLGLGPPIYLSDLLALGHVWRTVDNLDPESNCLIYWQPASCRARPPQAGASPPGLLPDCALVESSFELEPLAVDHLPARTGFCESYTVDPVPVGFYRVRSAPRSSEPAVSEGLLEAPGS